MEPLKLATKRALYLRFTSSSVAPIIALRAKYKNNNSIESSRITARFSYPISQEKEIESAIRSITSQQAPFLVKLKDLVHVKPGDSRNTGLRSGLSYRTETESSELAALWRDLEREMGWLGMEIKSEKGEEGKETVFGLQPTVVVAGGMSEVEAERAREEILREGVERGPLVADALCLGFTRPKGHRWKAYKFGLEGMELEEGYRDGDEVQKRSDEVVSLQ